MQANRMFALFCVGVCGLDLVPAGAGASGAVTADVAPVPAAKVHPLLRQMAAESAEPVKTWVFFADKGLTTPAEKDAAVRSVAASYNPRAVQRRFMRGEHARRGQPIFGEWDLPVCAAYADAVAATGAKVHVRSKWVNAVSVWATPAQIDEIAKLPFVVKMQPVARRARIDLPEPRQPADVPEADKEPVRGETSINYGLSQPQLSQINLIALHDAGYTGQGVVIGILDTGFERTHVAFNNPTKPVNVIAEYDFVDDDPVTSKQTGDPSSQHEHGTMILGCIGSYQPGSLVGGAFDASFVLAKTEDTTGEYPAEEDNYVAGLEFIEFHGADMSTASLGYIDWYTQDQLDGLTAVTTIAINTHTALGVHHCNAAGNEYHDSNPATSSLIAPADGFQVITCGAATSSGSIASFSSDGPTADGRIKPEVLALGSGTDTVDPFSTTGYTTASGTSLSTPLVASALACLIQARPYWTVDRMRERLFESASDFVANGQPDPLFVRGYGIVDAFAAYDVCSDAGSVVLDSNVYACDGSVSILVNDCGLNTDDNVAETVTVTVASDSEPLGETVLLTETDPAAAEFTGEITLSTTDAPGVLWVDHADLVTVTYIDADDGAGGVNVPVTAPAAVDCQAPAIQNVQTTAVQPRSAVVQITANEAVKGTVHYGTTCGTWTGTTPGAGYANPTQVSLTGLQDDTTYYYAVEAEDRAGNTSSADNGGACYTFTTPEVPDFFTELFASNNDLDNLTLTFTPNGSNDFYAGCVEEITELPVDPAGGTPLTLSDDSYATVNLAGGAQVLLYGVSYSTFYPGSNGYITFAAGDNARNETLADHFDLPRISAVFDDFDPDDQGLVSWKQLADRVVVTWEDLPEYNTSNSNTFQIEMHFDGTIVISYLGIAASDGLAGLSAGNGVDPDYYPSDLSAMGACGPKPPMAQSASYETGMGQEFEIVLSATDDGLPDPPAALTYVITQLPTRGGLFDPGTDQAIAAVPYTLVDGGATVLYRPSWGTSGQDSFRFKANDGGMAPDGGDSNEATVSVMINAAPPGVVYSWPLDVNPGWSIEGQWAFGTPKGGGTHNKDPQAAYTGSYVYGYNLYGDYANNLSLRCLTTTAIDCTRVSQAQLRFWRWLGVEAFDSATVEVSADGQNWSTVWSNQTEGVVIVDMAWTPITLDLSAVADGSPTVFVRWGMGPTDGYTTYPGWNIDDVEIWGVESPAFGDHDGDGDVDLEDFASMPGCLTGPDAGAVEIGCEAFDFDVDGDVDLGDFAAFQAVY